MTIKKIYTTFGDQMQNQDILNSQPPMDQYVKWSMKSGLELAQPIKSITGFLHLAGEHQ